MKNREQLLGIARAWNERLRDDDKEHTLGVLAQCVMKAILQSDVPEVVSWARDHRLSPEVRCSYTLGLQRFVKRPGTARDALLDLVKDEGVGSAAVWVLAGVLKSDALPLLRELRESSPHDSVRAAASVNVKKLEARLRQVHLLNASPAMLPMGHLSDSVELDVDCLPELLSDLECALKGHWSPHDREQLALSANQIRRNSPRFHIVPLSLSDGSATQFGFGLCWEDEGVIVVEVHFDRIVQDGVKEAVHRFMEGH